MTLAHQDNHQVNLTLVKEIGFKQTPILFRQSPFNSEEIMILTEGSVFYTLNLNSDGDFKTK